MLNYFQPHARRVSTCAFVAVAAFLTAAPTFAQSSTVSGQLTAYSTIYSIGVEWDIFYDTNHNAVVDVAFRDPAGSWRQASPLVRIDYNGRNMLAGSVMFLEPDMTYQVRLTLSDPDGGGDVREVSVRTLKLPTPPANGRVLHVVPGSGGGDGSSGSPFGGIDAAQAVAQPGDTFLMHGGYYGGRLIFHRPGTSAAYIAWKAAGDGEVTVAGIDIMASHLWFEGLTVRDQHYGTRTDLAPTNVVITRSTFINNFYSIYLNGGGSAWYIADNVIVGATPLETQSDEGEGIELWMTSGHTVAHNSITNVADGVSYPLANVDIFGNDIFDTSDDGLELDFGLANVRAWGNRIHNAYHNGISFQPQESGPWYIIRNQIVGNVESPFKFRTTDRFVLVNNTIASYAGSVICCNQNQLFGGILRNNLWISAQGGQIWALDAMNDWRTDFDYDGFDWGDAPYPLFYAGNVYYDLPSFSRASGLESHGIRVFKDACFSDFRVPGPTPTRIPPHLMSLRPDCNAVDAGAILPNLSDRYEGRAPDLGAHEYGQLAAVYGPRPVGTTPSDPPPVPPPVPPPSGSPSPWPAQDIGAVAVSGSTSEAGGVWTLAGAGSDIWGSTDAFHYAARPLIGDGTIVARVAAVSAGQAWGKAGVMLRSSLDPSSAHAFVFVTPEGANGIAFQRRATDGAATDHTSGGGGTAAVWLRLTRRGSVVTASRSGDGQQWTVIGSAVVVMGTEIYAGLAVTSHDPGAPLVATFDNVDVQAEDGTWVTGDIGSVGAAGFASMDGGTVVVGGSGADIWGTADAFRYVYRVISGDFEIAARVASLDAVDQWTKAGLMIRASADPWSAHASIVATPSTVKGVAFQRRPSEGAASLHTAGPALAPPIWLRLSRQGSVVTVASRSSSSEPWTVIGAESIALPPSVLVGVAVTSHADGAVATAVLENLTVTAR